jgi:hypothetical protein
VTFPKTNPRLQVQNKIDLVALVRSRGVLLRSSNNRNYVGFCPFCANQSEAFFVWMDHFLCSSCNAHGDAVGFLARLDRLSRRHALEVLATDRIAAFSSGKDRSPRITTVPRLSNPITVPSDKTLTGISDASMLDRVTAYYHNQLTKSSEAMDFLNRLGPRAAAAVETFGLGLADRTLGFRIPRANRKQGLALRRRLRQIGLYRSTNREHLNGCLVLPIPGKAGQGGEVCALYGYRIAKSWLSVPLVVAPSGPPAGVWNGKALDGAEIVLADTPVDALALWAHGIDRVTFVLRSLQRDDSLVALLLQRHVSRVRLAYAATEDGETHAERDAKLLSGIGIEVFRVRFPWGMGATAYALRQHVSNVTLASLVNTARYFAGHTTLATATAGAHVLSESAWGDMEMHFGERTYRVSGLARNRGFATLRASVRLLSPRVRTPGHENRIFMDRLDLARDAARRSFVTRAAHESGLDAALIKRDVGRMLLAIEERQYALRAGGVGPHTVRSDQPPDKPHASSQCDPPSVALPPATLHMRVPSALSRRTREIGASIRTIVAARNASKGAMATGRGFTRRDVRVALGMSVTQVRLHLERLTEVGQIAVQCGRTGSTFRYVLRDHESDRPNRRYHLENALRDQPGGGQANLAGGGNLSENRPQPAINQQVTVQPDGVT